MYVYNSADNIVSIETATSVSSGGAQATFPFPSSLTQSGYSLAAVNQVGGSQGYATAGVNMLSIASSQTISGNPFGVTVGSANDAFSDCNTCAGGTRGSNCTSGSRYVTFPVVSLYSENQVMVNGTAVNVGANPTAVASYPASSITKTVTNSCEKNVDTYSGNTRALVANSGSNSVSIVDIFNDNVLSNLTVGNQPVAIAVNTAGTAAYVANYKDSTVTPIDLSAGTAGTSVKVGGQPTSVALTSSGILWVGGVGFLTEINTQNMSMTATETVTGKTIISLGYTDSLSQLMATTVDSSGNVYSDEVNPASVRTGGTYTLTSSNKVSSLGNHLNTSTNTQVQSFSATLANASIINTNQVGAPTLVVQDGWAVVTATPTGFTISDATVNQVLISQTTPSPITAIAVDPKLNVVYLTEPDSNILLTVPLPGIN